MLIDTEQLAQRENWKEPREWRTFQLTPSQKCRFLVKGINSKGYRIAQERLTEHLRLTCGNLTNVDDYEETTLAKHMTIIAHHLVDDWEGIYDKETGTERQFTHNSLATILKYSGDLGIIMQGWILEQASDIQMIADKELEVAVGKPWSFSDIITKSSEEKKTKEKENDSESQE